MNDEQRKAMFAKTGSNQSSVTISDAEAIKNARTVGFPPTDTKVGIQKAWYAHTFPVANKLMIDRIESELGIKLDENGAYTIKDRINGKEYSASFRLSPTVKNKSYRNDSGEYTGFVISLPKDIPYSSDVKKELPDIDFEIKHYFKSRSEYGNYVNIPASNTSKISSVTPYLLDILNMSIKQQALNEVNDDQRKESQQTNKKKLLGLHKNLINELRNSGFEFEYREYEVQYGRDPEVRETDDTHSTLLVSDIKLPNHRDIPIQSFIDQTGKVKYGIGRDYHTGGIGDLTEIKLRKILDIIKDES